METHDVFISFAGDEDRKHANILDSELRQLGKKVWLDKREIGTGVTIDDRLRDGVRRSRFLCAVITPRYMGSWYTGLEAAIALDREGLIAPVRVMPCLFEGAPPSWCAARAYADFRSSFSQGWLALVDGMTKAEAASRTRKISVGGGVFTLGALIAYLWPRGAAIPENFQRLLAHAPPDRLRRIADELDVSYTKEKAITVRKILLAAEDKEAVLHAAFTLRDLRPLARSHGIATNQDKASLLASLLELL